MAFAASNAKKSNPARAHSLAPGTQKTLCLQGYPRKSEKDNVCEKIVLGHAKMCMPCFPAAQYHLYSFFKTL